MKKVTGALLAVPTGVEMIGVPGVDGADTVNVKRVSHQFVIEPGGKLTSSLGSKLILIPQTPLCWVTILVMSSALQPASLCQISSSKPPLRVWVVEEAVDGIFHIWRFSRTGMKKIDT